MNIPISGNVQKHTQIIQFVGGVKKTIRNVVRIDEGELLCLVLENGTEFLIDKSKVLWVERYIERPIRNETKKKKAVREESVKDKYYS